MLTSWDGFYLNRHEKKTKLSQKVTTKSLLSVNLIDKISLLHDHDGFS